MPCARFELRLPAKLPVPACNGRIREATFVALNVTPDVARAQPRRPPLAGVFVWRRSRRVLRVLPRSAALTEASGAPQAGPAAAKVALPSRAAPRGGWGADGAGLARPPAPLPAGRAQTRQPHRPPAHSNRRPVPQSQGTLVESPRCPLEQLRSPSTSAAPTPHQSPQPAAMYVIKRDGRQVWLRARLGGRPGPQHRVERRV